MPSLNLTPDSSFCRAGSATLTRFGKSALCILILVGVVLILLHRIFMPGFLVYRDNPAHMAEAYSYVESLRRGGSFLDGWSMSHSAGYPLLLYYPKTMFWLIAGCHFLLSLSVDISYKLVVFLSILLPVVGIFFLIRKDGMFLPSLLCSLLFLCQNNLVHYSLSGMASNALATGILFLFGRALFGFTDNPTHKRALGAGLLLGLLSLTHLYIVVGGAILWACIFVSSLAFAGKGKRLRSLFLLLTPVVGILTSCCYVYPFAKTSSWLTPAEGQLPLVPFGTILGNLFWKGDFFSHARGIGVAANVLGNVAIVVGILFALLGIAYALDGKKKERGFHVRAVSILLFIVVSSAVAWGIIVPGVGLKAKWLESFSLFRSTKIHGYRFMVLARAGMAYFSAYGLSRLLKDRTLPAFGGLGRLVLAGKFRWPVLIPVVGIVFVLPNFALFFYDRTLDEIRENPFFPARDSALLTTSSSLSTAKDFTKVCDWLKQNGDNGNRRVFLQDTLGNALLEWRDIGRRAEEAASLDIVTSVDTITHFTHLPAVCPVYSGMPEVGSWIGGNLFPIEKISISEDRRFFDSSAGEFDDMDLVLKKRYLQRLNVHYLVTCEPRLRSRLMSSRCFTHKETFGPFDVFELPAVFYTMHKPGWAYFSLPERLIPNNKIEVTRFDNSGIDISFENYATRMELFVAVCHHPFWKASVDGAAIPVEADDIGLMKIRLALKDEKGRPASLMGKHILKLRYVPERGASVVISLVSSILCVVLLVLPRLKRRRPGGTMLPGAPS
jgi:hypothetical protein